jgi:hypothetical protein
MASVAGGKIDVRQLAIDYIKTQVGDDFFVRDDVSLSFQVMIVSADDIVVHGRSYRCDPYLCQAARQRSRGRRR